MYSLKSIFYFLSWLLIVQSTPLENVEEVKAAIDGGPYPLYRYFNAQLGDHFYTLDQDELGPSGSKGYVSEGIAARCYANQHANTVAFLRYYNAQLGDHFYTTNVNELGPHGGKGYVSEGTACYVFVQAYPETVPFYRYYNKITGDHFYTTNWNELGHGKNGYVPEGTAAYVLPA